jgi:hypothetical protein
MEIRDLQTAEVDEEQGGAGSRRVIELEISDEE